MIDNVGGAADAFFFSHHTFTHENLDNATRYDADQQLGLNIALAKPVRETRSAGPWAGDKNGLGDGVVKV